MQNRRIVPSVAVLDMLGRLGYACDGVPVHSVSI